jgi:rubrerythrin
MNPSLARRVQQLEQRFHVVDPPPPTAEDLLFHEKLGEPLVQMDEKHTDVVREDFAHPVSEASELTLAVCQRAIDHIRQNTPLAFPKEVAEVYLSRKVSSETECEGCGYTVPAASFRVCPLCGGRLGWPVYTPGE